MKEKKQMTAYEQSLFNDLKKLSKRANQRIVRLERLTDSKEPFEVKKLADSLSIEGVNAWTKGRKGKIFQKYGYNIYESSNKRNKKIFRESFVESSRSERIS